MTRNQGSLPRVFGVFGFPVAHSRSPAMHRAAMRAMGLPHDYFAFAVKPDHLAEALRGAFAMGLGGLNLTVPHKTAALPLVDAATETARRIGAVNTVLVQAGRLVGDNTDGVGFARALRELGGTPIERAVVLGAGGAARAIVDALRHPPAPLSGVPWAPLRDPVRVRWVSRSPDKLPKSGGVTPTAWDDVGTAIGDADLLVNATTVGMKRGPVGFPIPINPAHLPAGARVMDIVYPRPTYGLLDAAEQAGKAVQDGRAMLLWQGVAALARWMGQPVPADAIAAMRDALN